MMLIALFFLVGLLRTGRAFRQAMQHLMTEVLQVKQDGFSQAVQQQRVESNETFKASNEWWPWGPDCDKQKANFAETCRAEIKAIVVGGVAEAIVYPGEDRLIQACSGMLDWIAWMGNAESSEPTDWEYLAMPVYTPNEQECSEPAYWTGNVDDSFGFSPFLRKNTRICLLHHGDAKRRQASVFGVSMQAADYLSGCDKSVSRQAWGAGSRQYAKYHARFGNAGNIPVFIGHNFGRKRPGKDSILFAHEIRNIIIQTQVWGKYSGKVRLEFLNFSPLKDCRALYDIPVGFGPVYHTTLNELFSANATSLEMSPGLKDSFLFRIRTPPGLKDVSEDMRTNQRIYRVCMDCPPIDPDGGPTEAEIGACYDAARSASWSPN